MENPHDQTLESVVCENCKASNDWQKKFCSQCSFPIGGNEDEQRSFRLIVSSRKRLLDDAKNKIKSAKTIIYVLAGIFVVFGLITGFAQDDYYTMVVNLVLSLVFLILAAWSEKNPFGAILTAFIIYVTVHITNAFADPATIAQGIIIKIFFIAAFVKGIRSAQEAQAYLKELEKFKAAPAH